MPHTTWSLLIHVVFSTKDRAPLLAPALRVRLFDFLSAVALNHQMKVDAIGGVEDHMHVLLAIRCTNTVSECVQVLKAVSSKWLHDSFPDLAGFAWQQGYGAFSIGISQFRQTARYIEAQEQHHKRRTFEQEWALFLKRHNIPYDEEFFAP